MPVTTVPVVFRGSITRVFGPCRFCATPSCGNINTPLLITVIPINFMPIRICIISRPSCECINNFHMLSSTRIKRSSYTWLFATLLSSLEHVFGFHGEWCNMGHCMAFWIGLIHHNNGHCVQPACWCIWLPMLVSSWYGPFSHTCHGTRPWLPCLLTSQRRGSFLLYFHKLITWMKNP